MNRRYFLEVGSTMMAASLFIDPLSLFGQMKKSKKGKMCIRDSLAEFWYSYSNFYLCFVFGS